MKKLITIIFLFLAFYAGATTYYVRTDGNNANAGTTNSSGGAWRTVTYATTHTSSGDIIHVVAGTYLEAGQIFLPVGVNLEGDGVTSVITSSWTTSFFPILDLRSAEGTNGNQYIKDLKIDGRSYASPRGIEVGGRSNVSIHDCTISNFKEEGVIFDGRQDFDTLPPTIYATGNTFYNNTVTDCSMYSGFGRGCLSIGGQTGMLIHDNTISQPARTGGNQIGWPIKYYSEGYLKGVKIYNNTLYKDPAGATGWNFAVELFNFQGLEMYNNTSTGSWDFNFQGDRGIYPWVAHIHHNTISSPVGTGRIEQGLIWEYNVDGALIDSNRFDNLAQIMTFYCRPWTITKDIVFKGNLCTNIGYPPSIGDGSCIGGFNAGTNKYIINNFKVYNNTFVGNSTSKINQGIGFGAPDSGYIKNIDIRNNYLSNIVYPGFSIGATGGATIDSVNISYNNIIGDDQYGIGTNHVYLSSGTIGHYTNTNNTNNTPSFLDSTNYTLKVTSALIDAGTNVGDPYTGAAPDKGYKEYVTGGNASPTSNAGIDQSTTSTSVTLNGTGSYDPDGTISTYAWTKISGTGGTIVSAGSATTSVTGLSVGVYVFQLTVTDNNGATATDTVQVTITSAGGGTTITDFIQLRKTIFKN